MGTTTKIVYGCILLLSLVLLFLIFSMQKSAQLTVDLQNIEHSIQQKDQKIAAMMQQLDAVVISDKEKGAVIPELTNKLEAIKNEKLAYLQQLDELQEQLRKTNTQLAEFSRLKEKYKQHLLLLAETEKARDAANSQTEQQAEKLKHLQETLHQTHEQLGEFTGMLEQKDLIIKSFKEKLKDTAEESVLTKDTLAKNRLNLSLVLDDLTAKNQIIKDLSLKTGQPPSAAHLQSDKVSTPYDDKTTPAISGAIAEAKESKLINDTLHESIREQDSLIETLHTELLAKEALISTASKDLEALQANEQELNNQIEELLLVEQNNRQELVDLKSGLTDKEKELDTTRKQLAEATDSSETLAAELDPVKTTLLQAQQEISKLTEALTTANDTLEQERTTSQALTTDIEAMRRVLSQTETKYEELAKQMVEQTDSAEEMRSTLNAKTSSAESSLQEAKEKASSLEVELTKVKTELAAKEGTIQRVTAQLAESRGLIDELEVRLDQESTTKMQEEDSDTEGEDLRMAALIEEVAAAQALSAEHAVTLQNLKTQLTLLTREKEELSLELQAELQKNSVLTEQNSALHTKVTEPIDNLENAAGSTSKPQTTNRHLQKAFHDSPNKLTTELEKIKTLEDERGGEKDNDQDGKNIDDPPLEEVLEGATLQTD